MKRLISAIFAMSLMLAALAGCGGNGATEASPNSIASTSTVETAPAASNEQTEIVFMVLDSFTKSEEDALYTTTKEFMEANPDIKVTIEPTPANNIKDKFTTAALSGGGPDIVSLDSAGWAIDGAAMGILSPLDERFNAIKDQFQEGPVNSGLYQNQYYSVPWYMNNTGMYYNKDILAEAGVDKVPETWEELAAACDKVNAIGKGGVTSQLIFSYVMYSFFAQAGNPVFDTSGEIPVVTVNNESGKKAFYYLADLHTVHNAYPESMKDALSWDQTYAPFARGEVAFMLCGDWGNWGVSSANPDLNYGIAPLPKGDNAATTLGGYTLCISKNTKNYDAAWKYIEWLTASEQNQVLLSYGRMGARKDIDTEALIAENPHLEIFIQQADTTVARPTVIKLAEADMMLTDAFKSVFLGQATKEEALDKLEEDLNRFIENEYK